MVQISKRSIIVLSCVCIIIALLIISVYFVYLSPHGWMAKSVSDIQDVVSEEKAYYTTLSGEEVELTDYESDVLVVNVWASWSPYTKADHELLSKLKSKYNETITIRAVNRKESKETAIAYLDTIGTYEGIEYVIDTTDFLFNTLEGYAMPETFLFDSVGNVRFHKRGVLSYDEITNEIETLLRDE